MTNSVKDREAIDWQEVRRVLEGNERIEQAILFGSRAKGTQRKGSDIDIALQGKKLALRDALDIGDALEECMFPYTFDVIIYQSIREKDLLEHIDRVGVVIYIKEVA